MLIKRKSMKKHMSNIHCREEELPNIVRIANALFRCTDKSVVIDSLNLFNIKILLTLLFFLLILYIFGLIIS